jgi:hypothetical protein
MRFYGGFELIEQVVTYPPQCAGAKSVAIYDELIGTVWQTNTMEEAEQWIDGQCTIADTMLWNIIWNIK